MAFGDTIDDLLLFKRYRSDDALTPGPREIAQPLAVWQAFDAALRDLQGTPHEVETQSWARHYEVGLAWVYTLGPKVRVTIYQPVQDRHLTLPVEGGEEVPTAPAFSDTFTAGRAQLDL